MIFLVLLGIIAFIILFPLIATISYWFEILGYRLGMTGKSQEIADD